MIINEDVLAFVKDMYLKKFGTLDTFDENFSLYQKLPIFKACENIHEKLTDYTKSRDELVDNENEFVADKSIKPEIHWIMRSLTQYYITQAFEAMKIDLTDPNISVNALGKGTPGRIAKMWCGNDPEDTTELLSGRWNKEPALSIFPNDGLEDAVEKQVDVIAVCSHHFLPFSTLNGGKGVIKYIPKDRVLGISKLQRFVNWASRRGWLQEDLTNYIGNTIKRIAQTEDVYVRLEGLVHGCEKYRGANSHDGNLTTEFKSGVFKQNKSRVIKD